MEKNGINEVFDKIESSKNIEQLIELWNKVANHKYTYSLSNLWDIIDSIKEKCLIVEGKDIDKSRFYHALDQMKSNK